MKAAGFRAKSVILVLSPSIDPPDLTELGSTARTATLNPKSVRYDPKTSIKVDLPTPGVPERPMRIACFSDFFSSKLMRETADFL
jgi:hypothetical protein